MLTLTPQQTKVLAYLRAFFAANHCLPPNRVTANAFGWASSNAAHEIMLHLERAGALERNELGGYKFTRGGLCEALAGEGAAA